VGQEAQRRPEEPPMADSQLLELQNTRVLLEEARLLVRNLAYHRRAKLEARLELVLNEIDSQVEDLRANRG
jgi:hypothetical protein